MLHDIQAWLGRTGFPADTKVATMAPGLGKTTMWRISATSPDRDLVLRLFPVGNERVRDRETLAMRAASAAGLPVPDVVMTSTVADRPAIVMTLAPGTTVASALGPDRERARETGQKLGVLLGKLNLLAAPDGLAPPGGWLDRAGPALAPLRDRLAALPRADRLLHLDFHPENVMMEGDEVTAIIDWTNTLPGPPHIDLGRSRAILRLVRTLPRVAPEVAGVVEIFEAGLIEGHERIHGPDPDPNLTLAWGVGTQCVDFAPLAVRGGTWVTPEVLKGLEATRDALIARVRGDAPS